MEIVPWNIIRDSHTSNGDFIVMGLWNSVRLELVPKMHLSRPYLYTESIEHDRAVLRLEVEIADGQVPELSPYGGTCERRTDHCRAFDTGLSGCVQERTVQICFSLWDENGVVYQESEDVPLCDFEGPGMDPHYYELQFYRRKMTARISQIVDMRHITLSELCEAS